VIDLEHQVISHTINLGCTGLGDCYRGLGLTPNGQREYVAGWYEHLVLFLSVDIDLDGLKTFEEDALGTSDKNADSDGDGLSDTAEVFVHGTNPTIPDTDEDGCSDGVELGPDQTLGGRRDPLNPNDYFNPSHDGKNRIDDILAVVRQYFDDAYLDPPTNTIPNPAYNPDTDRTPLGPNLWNLGPPNGLQRIPDILAMMAQYYHDCS
jgi:hypothetical protein